MKQLFQYNKSWALLCTHPKGSFKGKGSKVFPALPQDNHSDKPKADRLETTLVCNKLPENPLEL